MNDAPLLALTGPTAAGKSAVAMALAARTPLEIISVDSALVYRGMDIGTAKPGDADRAAVPHHLIDFLDPLQAYSAARFVEDLGRLAADITARGRQPLLVGGTMMYLKALRDGLDAMPAGDAAVRAAIDAEAAVLGWPAMHAQLMAVDAATARRLAPHDAQRVQRALEVWRVSGQPMSVFQSRGKNAASLAAGAARAGTRRLTLVSLEPDSRAWLHARIAQRFDSMLAAGFVDEVRALRSRGDLSPALPSMRCVGYRQAWECLDAGDLRPLRDRAIAATRQLAKRQLTWLRSMPDRRAVACDAPDAVVQALQALQTPADAELTR